MKLKDQFRVDEKEGSFYNGGGKTLEQGVQRGGRCPLHGNIEGQVEWVSGQPDVPVCGSRDDLEHLCKGPLQLKLFMILL